MNAGNINKKGSIGFGGLTKYKGEREMIHTRDAH